ncbi:MAG: translation elongation factor Ts [Desulfovibrionaceae bacterium]
MAISAQQVKALRDKTGAGMMDCKKALAECDGDEQAAVDWLRQKGIAKAAKRADRTASEGLIAFVGNDAQTTASMVEFKCETDFVSKSDKFQDVGKMLGDAVAASDLSAATPTAVPQAFLDAPRDGGSLMDKVNDLIAVIGEAIQIGRFVKLAVDGAGVLGTYVHSTGKIGVVVEVTCANAATAATEGMKELAKNLAMQVAAANPLCVSPSELPQDVLDREKAVYRQQTLEEGKPENIVDKIVDGRVKKYYKEVCLLEQPYIREDKKSVADLVKETGKALGDTLTVTRFVRLQLGAEEA